MSMRSIIRRRLAVLLLSATPLLGAQAPVGTGATQTPQPASAPRPAAAVAQGERIAASRFCASCHQQDYAGQNEVPRIAGQREDYLLKALRDFRDGRRQGADGAMTEVLHGMQDEDLAALASYLSQLP